MNINCVQTELKIRKFISHQSIPARNQNKVGAAAVAELTNIDETKTKSTQKKTKKKEEKNPLKRASDSQVLFELQRCCKGNELHWVSTLERVASPYKKKKK